MSEIKLRDKKFSWYCRPQLLAYNMSISVSPYDVKTRYYVSRSRINLHASQYCCVFSTRQWTQTWIRHCIVTSRGGCQVGGWECCRLHRNTSFSPTLTNTPDHHNSQGLVIVVWVEAWETYSLSWLIWLLCPLKLFISDQHSKIPNK